jgi:hypothetical protein
MPRREKNIKTGIEGIGWEHVGWINVAVLVEHGLNFKEVRRTPHYI